MAVVIDPIQSVKGKVVIDAFRLIQPQTVVSGQEPRQTTSNIGHINKPSIQALIHGLNRHYYSIAVNYRKTELEQSMLMNLHKRNWTEGLTLRDFKNHKEGNEKSIKVCHIFGVRQTAGAKFAAYCAGDALALGSIQQVSPRGVDFDCGPAEDTACRETRSQASLGRGSGRSHGQSGGPKFSDNALGRTIDSPRTHCIHTSDIRSGRTSCRAEVPVTTGVHSFSSILIRQPVRKFQSVRSVSRDDYWTGGEGPDGQ